MNLKERIEKSDHSLNDIVKILNNYFQEKKVDDMVNSQQQKSIVADTAYFYLGCKPYFSLGELYYQLKIDKAFLYD